MALEVRPVLSQGEEEGELTRSKGGLGHLAIQYAAALSLRIITVDTGAAKEKLCRDLGGPSPSPPPSPSDPDASQQLKSFSTSRRKEISSLASRQLLVVSVLTFVSFSFLSSRPV